MSLPAPSRARSCLIHCASSKLKWALPRGSPWMIWVWFFSASALLCLRPTVSKRKVPDYCAIWEQSSPKINITTSKQSAHVCTQTRQQAATMNRELLKLMFFNIGLFWINVCWKLLIACLGLEGRGSPQTTWFLLVNIFFQIAKRRWVKHYFGSWNYSKW